MKKLLIVDDHRLFAEGVQFLIESAMEYTVVGVLGSGREVLPFLARNPVHLLLLDIELPDGLGFDLARTIRYAYPDTKVLALSILGDNQSIDRMMEAGAAGYCLKSAGRDELFTALQTVAGGGTYLPIDYVSHAKARKHRAERHSLTERETEVIQLIAEGGSTKKIADRLFLSARTIETHRKNIYRKLGVHTNVELTLFARSTLII